MRRWALLPLVLLTACGGVGDPAKHARSSAIAAQRTQAEAKVIALAQRLGRSDPFAFVDTCMAGNEMVNEARFACGMITAWIQPATRGDRRAEFVARDEFMRQHGCTPVGSGSSPLTEAYDAAAGRGPSLAGLSARFSCDGLAVAVKAIEDPAMAMPLVTSPTRADVTLRSEPFPSPVDLGPHRWGFLTTITDDYHRER